MDGLGFKFSLRLNRLSWDVAGLFGALQDFALYSEFLFDLYLSIELFDHFADSDKIAFGFPCRLIDAPSDPLYKVFDFT